MSDSAIAAVILAAGTNQRMGGRDKSQLQLRGQSLVEHIYEKVSPQVDLVLLNLDIDESLNPKFNKYQIVPDLFLEKMGPLAGIYSAMRWIKNQRSDISKLLVSPCDSPFLPNDLVQRLHVPFVQSNAVDVVYASSKGNKHYVNSLWNIDVAGHIEAYLAKGERSVGRFLHARDAVTVEFPVINHDPFFNINTPEDLEDASKI